MEITCKRRLPTGETRFQSEGHTNLVELSLWRFEIKITIKRVIYAHRPGERVHLRHTPCFGIAICVRQQEQPSKDLTIIDRFSREIPPRNRWDDNDNDNECDDDDRNSTTRPLDLSSQRSIGNVLWIAWDSFEGFRNDPRCRPDV